MDSENLLIQVLKNSLVDADRIARDHWGRLVPEVAVSVLAAALFAERARIGSAALERAVFGKTAGTEE